MNIKQAKEIFNIFLQDIETNNEGNYILDLRLNPNGTWSHFNSKDIEAFKTAFKSLDMWEKFLYEISKVLDKRYCEVEDKCLDNLAEGFLQSEKAIKIRIKEIIKEIEGE